MNAEVPAPDVPPRLLTIKKAAEYLGISRKTLYFWIQIKRIPYFRIGRLVFFDRSAVETWLEEHRVTASPSPQPAVSPDCGRS